MSGYKFGKGGPTWNGIPMINGVPVTFGNTQNAGAGKIIYVNPTTGSNGNKGTSMDKPVSTIAYAYTLTSSNNHDVIVLSATSGHSASDQLSVTNSRTHFWGMDAVGRYYGQRTRWTMGLTTGSAIAVVKNTGVGNTFSNIKFDSSDTLTTSIYAFAEGGEYTVIENCEIYKSSDLGTATAAELLMNGDSAHVRNCTIGSLVNQVTAARTNVLLTRETITGKVCRDVTIENCLFWLKSSSATASHIHATTATDVERMLLVKDCTMVVAKTSSGTVGDAVIIDSALTVGQILLHNTCNLNSTAIATTGNVGVFYYGPEIATTGTAGNPVSVSDS